MNYLAHLYLSGENPQRMVGGLLGDFIKGQLKGELPSNIESGIQLHRQIDVFTDRQPEVQSAIERFLPPYRRFAGILLDLCYDHLLAANWSQYHNQELDVFCQDFYRTLTSYHNILPAGAKRFCEVAPRVNWLQNYARFAELEIMLERIGQRFRNPVPLHEAFPLLEQQYPLLEQEFHQLFPRLIEFSVKQRLESNQL